MNERFNTAEHMRDTVFFDGPNASGRYSRFWLLLVLSAVIASAGVIADSTATVIGAMIVAPLMTPILGVMLATVLGDRDNLIRSLLLVVAGQQQRLRSAISLARSLSPMFSPPRTLKWRGV